MKLFQRAWSVVIGDLEVSELAIAFDVKKSTKKEPNTAELSIYNLSDENRKKLTEAKKYPLRIEAGYVGNLSQIYLGEVRSGFTTVEGPDYVTRLSSGDGEKAHKVRLLIPIGPKTPADVALRAIARTLGVNAGNSDAMAATLAKRGKVLYPRGTVLSGNAAQNLTDFCRSAGLEWSIQDGALQILDIGAPLNERPIILSPDSGLIGSPSSDADGKISAKCFMIPGLRPGIRVQMDSLQVKGIYRITQAQYQGDTQGAEWSISLLLEKPK